MSQTFDSDMSENQELWSSQIHELQLKETLAHFFEEKETIDLIITYHGNLSTKCANFLPHDMRNRKEEFKSLKPKTYKVTEFTIELWLYCDRFPGKNEGWVAIRCDNQWYGACIHFQFYGNILQLTRAGSADHWFVKYKFKDKLWYHIAVTYPKHEFYVNGEFISEDKRLSEEISFHDAYIGHWENTQHQPDRIFCGKMKEFRLWNRRRTRKEIVDNILCGAKPHWIKDGLIIYHSLDQYNNNTVHDLYEYNNSKAYQHTNKSTKFVTDDFKLENLNLKCYTVAPMRDNEQYDKLDAAAKQSNVKLCSSPVTCESVKRIIKYLHFYDVYDVDKDTDMLINYFEKEKNILNDFHHILHYHLGEKSSFSTVSEIQNEYKIIHNMVNKMVSKCVLEKCQSFKRNNRVRGSRSQNDNDNKTDNDDLVQCYIDILDAIHCFCIHSYDYGMKVKTNKILDKNKQNNEEMDDDEGINIEDYTDETFIKLMKTIKQKSTNVVKLRGLSRNDKFTIVESDYDISINDDEKNENIHNAKSQLGCYSFGVNLRYWGNNDQGSAIDGNKLFISQDGYQVYSKYNTFREEILKNNIFALDIKDWILVVEKMKLISESKAAKTVHAKDVFNDDSISIGTKLVDDIRKGDLMTDQHIIAVILYTDFSEISFEFSKTFRFIEDDNNDINKLLMRNREYYNWAKLLKETVNIYGDMVWTSKIQHFYSGVSSPMVFSSFVTEFFCPTSTSAQTAVAALFAKHNGIVIDLVKNSGGCLLKYFNCTFISCYPDEDERLFFANTEHIYDNGRGANYSLKFASIFLISEGHNYQFFLSILTFIDDLLNGQEQPNVLVFVTKKIAKAIITLFKHFDPKNKFKSKQYPKYILDTFERYIADKNQIIMYGYYVTQQTQLNKYLFHNNFLPHRTTPLPSVHLLFITFKNCNLVRYIFDRYRKGNFTSSYMDSLLSEIDSLQNSDMSTTQTRTVILESHQYEDALTYDGTSLNNSSFLEIYQEKFEQKNCSIKIENHGKRLIISINSMM